MLTYMIILPPCGQREGNKDTLNPSSSFEAKCGATIVDLRKEQKVKNQSKANTNKHDDHGHVEALTRLNST